MLKGLKKIQNTVLGNDKEITCESITNINKVDYPTCSIEFEDNTAKVTITGSGKIGGLNVCNADNTSAVATIYVGDNWNISNVISSNRMFEDATNIVGGNGTIYKSSYIDKTYARVDTASTPGYFTYKGSN